MTIKVFPDKTQDQEFKDLGDLGFTGAINDRQFKYLRSLGRTGSLSDMLFKLTAGVTPTYLGGLGYDQEVIQNTAMTALDFDNYFTGAIAYSMSVNGLPTGVSLSGTTVSGTPTVFQGRMWCTVRAHGTGGTFAERTFLVSSRPDEVAGAFGVAYTTTYADTTFAATTLENASNILIKNVVLTGQLQLRNLQNVLMIDCTVDHTDETDGVRFSGTGAGCDQVVIYDNRISNVNKDGINLSGDWPWHGPDIHILNNVITASGNNASPKEHGMYLHSMCHVVGNVIKTSNFGNAISLRSSANVKTNFIDTASDAGVSYFADHPASSTHPVVIEGNVIVNASTGAADGDVILRDVVTPANRVDVFDILSNQTTANSSSVEIGTGYGDATVTNTGNVVLSDLDARNLFPTLLPIEILSFTISAQDVNGDLPIDLEVTADRALPYTSYIVAVPTGDPSPTATQVFAGQNSAGGAAAVAFNFNFSTATTSNVTDAISGVSGDFDFYAVVEDADDNQSGVASVLNITLTAVVAAATRLIHSVGEFAGSSTTTYSATIDFVAQGVEVGDTILIAYGAAYWASTCTVGGIEATKTSTDIGNNGGRVSGFEYVVQSGDVTSSVTVSVTIGISQTKHLLYVFATPLSVVDRGNAMTTSSALVSSTLAGTMTDLVAVAGTNYSATPAEVFSSNVTKLAADTDADTYQGYAAIGNAPASNTVTFDHAADDIGLIVWGVA